MEPQLDLMNEELLNKYAECKLIIQSHRRYLNELTVILEEQQGYRYNNSIKNIKLNKYNNTATITKDFNHYWLEYNELTELQVFKKYKQQLNKYNNTATIKPQVFKNYKQQLNYKYLKNISNN